MVINASPLCFIQVQGFLVPDSADARLLLRNVVFRLVQRLYEFHALEIHRADFLALGPETLLGYELLCVYDLRLTVFPLSSEDRLHARVEVIVQCDEI